MLRPIYEVPTSKLGEPCPMVYAQPVKESKETVNHPSHYNRQNSMECIDEMILIFGKEATMNFCLLNAWKYRYRAGDKNGQEDIAKSDWYINKYKELKESSQTKSSSITISPAVVPTSTPYDYWDGPTHNPPNSKWYEVTCNASTGANLVNQY